MKLVGFSTASLSDPAKAAGFARLVFDLLSQADRK